MEYHHHSPEVQELRRYSWGPRSFFWKRVAQGVGFVPSLFPICYYVAAMFFFALMAYFADAPYFSPWSGALWLSLVVVPLGYLLFGVFLGLMALLLVKVLWSVASWAAESTKMSEDNIYLAALVGGMTAFVEIGGFCALIVISNPLAGWGWVYLMMPLGVATFMYQLGAVRAGSKALLATADANVIESAWQLPTFSIAKVLKLTIAFAVFMTFMKLTVLPLEELFNILWAWIVFQVISGVPILLLARRRMNKQVAALAAQNRLVGLGDPETSS